MSSLFFDYGPRICAFGYLLPQEFLQLAQELVLLRLRTALHRTRRVHRAIGPGILDRSAGNVFARVFVDAPAVAHRSVALDPLETAIGRAFGNVICLKYWYCYYNIINDQ